VSRQKRQQKRDRHGLYCFIPFLTSKNEVRVVFLFREKEHGKGKKMVENRNKKKFKKLSKVWAD